MAWPASVRRVVTAGAPISPETAARFRETFGRHVHVFYGASECGGICFDRSKDGVLPDGCVGTPLDGIETASVWGRYDRCIVTSGLSKAYGLPGLRIGWVVGPPQLVDELWGVHDYTTIAPGALNDRLARIALEPTRRAKILARILLEHRMTTPEEIAAMACFVLSSHAGHITGQHLYVDGGYVHLDRALT